MKQVFFLVVKYDLLKLYNNNGSNNGSNNTSRHQIFRSIPIAISEGFYSDEYEA